VEIIVIDDFSENPFLDQLKSPFNAFGIPIRVLRLRENHGPGGARNVGVRAARGTYVAFLDSDDRFAAAKVDALLLEITGARANVVIAHRAVHGSRANDILLSLLKKWGSNKPIRDLVLGYANPFYTPCLCLPKNFALTIPRLQYCEDYLVSLNLVRRNLPLIILPERLSVLGRPPRSEGGVSHQMYRMLRGESRVRAFVAGSPRYPAITRTMMYIMIPLSYVRSHLTRGLEWMLRRLFS
jgi:glycosyltransferase involved in cell wall biosynthesis